MDDAAIRQLISRLNGIERTAVCFRKGVVEDTDPLAVSLGGADIPYNNVRTLGATVLEVGDTVAALAWGSDLLILDRIDADAGGWQFPTFLNGWTNFAAGDREVRFYRAGGRCHLEGIARAGSYGLSAFVLPAGFRPTQAGGGIFFPVVGDAVVGVVQVSTGGQVVPLASANAWVDLSSISFRCA
jgi:hypothetical protein